MALHLPAYDASGQPSPYEAAVTAPRGVPSGMSHPPRGDPPERQAAVVEDDVSMPSWESFGSLNLSHVSVERSSSRGAPPPRPTSPKRGEPRGAWPAAGGGSDRWRGEHSGRHETAGDTSGRAHAPRSAFVPPPQSSGAQPDGRGLRRASPRRSPQRVPPARHSPQRHAGAARSKSPIRASPHREATAAADADEELQFWRRRSSFLSDVSATLNEPLGEGSARKTAPTPTRPAVSPVTAAREAAAAASAAAEAAAAAAAALEATSSQSDVAAQESRTRDDSRLDAAESDAEPSFYETSQRDFGVESQESDAESTTSEAFAGAGAVLRAVAASEQATNMVETHVSELAASNAALLAEHEALSTAVAARLAPPTSPVAMQAGDGDSKGNEDEATDDADASRPPGTPGSAADGEEPPQPRAAPVAAPRPTAVRGTPSPATAGRSPAPVASLVLHGDSGTTSGSTAVSSAAARPEYEEDSLDSRTRNGSQASGQDAAVDFASWLLDFVEAAAATRSAAHHDALAALQRTAAGDSGGMSLAEAYERARARRRGDDGGGAGTASAIDSRPARVPPAPVAPPGRVGAVLEQLHRAVKRYTEQCTGEAEARRRHFSTAISSATAVAAKRADDASRDAMRAVERARADAAAAVEAAEAKASRNVARAQEELREARLQLAAAREVATTEAQYEAYKEADAVRKQHQAEMRAVEARCASLTEELRQLRERMDADVEEAVAERTAASVSAAVEKAVEKAVADADSRAESEMEELRREHEARIAAIGAAQAKLAREHQQLVGKLRDDAEAAQARAARAEASAAASVAAAEAAAQAARADADAAAEAAGLETARARRDIGRVARAAALAGLDLKLLDIDGVDIDPPQLPANAGRRARPGKLKGPPPDEDDARSVSSAPDQQHTPAARRRAQPAGVAASDASLSAPEDDSEHRGGQRRARQRRTGGGKLAGLERSGADLNDWAQVRGYSDSAATSDGAAGGSGGSSGDVSPPPPAEGSFRAGDASLSQLSGKVARLEGMLRDIRSTRKAGQASPPPRRRRIRYLGRENVSPGRRGGRKAAAGRSGGAAPQRGAPVDEAPPVTPRTAQADTAATPSPLASPPVSAESSPSRSRVAAAVGAAERRKTAGVAAAAAMSPATAAAVDEAVAAVTATLAASPAGQDGLYASMLDDYLVKEGAGL